MQIFILRARTRKSISTPGEDTHYVGSLGDPWSGMHKSGVTLSQHYWGPVNILEIDLHLDTIGSS